MRFWKGIDNLDKEFPEEEIERLREIGQSKIADELKTFVGKASEDKTKDKFWQRWSQIREMLFLAHIFFSNYFLIQLFSPLSIKISYSNIKRHLFYSYIRHNLYGIFELDVLRFRHD